MAAPNAASETQTRYFSSARAGELGAERALQDDIDRIFAQERLAFEERDVGVVGQLEDGRADRAAGGAGGGGDERRDGGRQRARQDARGRGVLDGDEGDVDAGGALEIIGELAVDRKREAGPRGDLRFRGVDRDDHENGELALEVGEAVRDGLFARFRFAAEMAERFEIFGLHARVAVADEGAALVVGKQEHDRGAHAVGETGQDGVEGVGIGPLGAREELLDGVVGGEEAGTRGEGVDALLHRVVEDAGGDFEIARRVVERGLPVGARDEPVDRREHGEQQAEQEGEQPRAEAAELERAGAHGEVIYSRRRWSPGCGGCGGRARARA